MRTYLARYQATWRRSPTGRCRGLTLAAAVVFAFQATTTSNAQTPNGSDETTADPCMTEPGFEQDTPSASDQELAEKLDRCNGVLKPPPIVDDEIEEQPPDTGKTPVIPPGELPEQQPESGEPN